MYSAGPRAVRRRYPRCHVSRSRNHGCGGDRFSMGIYRAGAPTQEVVTMAMGDVIGDDILATFDEPIHQLSRLLR